MAIRGPLNETTARLVALLRMAHGRSAVNGRIGRRLAGKFVAFLPNAARADVCSPAMYCLASRVSNMLGTVSAIMTLTTMGMMAAAAQYRVCGKDEEHQSVSDLGKHFAGAARVAMWAAHCFRATLNGSRGKSFPGRVRYRRAKHHPPMPLPATGSPRIAGRAIGL